ncbi:uncharacterized protein K02A2.6-like [Wyeomyia smithii]|uniref:uncharacterized protein K02A2.6-like n=1 Tax=Wyeomyia smithii TaxID=174621 RepID=UPI0024681206|nr:uncharacterized protein K02A2.6-like [Wyeomyia smithii]
MLRDKIIIGVQDKKLQLKLLDGKDEPLLKIVETCKIFEAAAENKQLLDRKVAQSDVVRHRRYCLAIKVTCDSCGRLGHFKRFCRAARAVNDTNNQANRGKPGSSKQVTTSNTVYSVNWKDAGNNLSKGQDKVGLDKDSELLSRYRINSNTMSDEVSRVRWTKRYRIKDRFVVFKLDTGADVNCIPLNIAAGLNCSIVSDCVDVVDYNSKKIQIHGEVSLPCYDVEKRTTQVADFVVVDDYFEPLLELETCQSFGLVERICSVQSIKRFPSDLSTFAEQNKDLFVGLGKFPGTCSIQLKDNSVPVLHYKKRIPSSLHDRLKNKLTSMVKQHIISPVDYPTDWVNNMQIVEKPNGSLRICLDPKPLNACIKREYFLIPTAEDILGRLNGKRVFTVLDLRNGFWQMELDPKSADLTTFMTPFGRYKWNRVPFGINSAPEMFQKRMVRIFGDIPGVEIYFDDLSIAGTDIDDHDRILTIVLDRARQTISSLIRQKSTIINIPKPQSTDVLRLQGLLKYLGKFIPNLSQRTAGLRSLTHNNVEWQWTDDHDTELHSLLNTISSKPTLAIFDPDAPIIVQTDSSKDGLGSVIMQKRAPVAYASRTLSKSEQKWAQIEKKLLAVVFACERFSYYLYGRNFLVQSDHKPLETLVRRDIDDVTPRLQRMFMNLLQYPGMCITYTPEDITAIGRTRALLQEFSARKFVAINNIEALRNDERYQRVVKYVENGWPSYHNLDDLCQLFHKYRDCLHYENGLLLKNHCLVIPTALQKLISKWLHAPHFGIEKTLARARNSYFWPGMTTDIAELVKNCGVCEKFTRNLQKEPLVQEDASLYPFNRVGTDLFEYAGKDYVVVIDAYSGYVFAEALHEKTARHVADTLDRIFLRYGCPTYIRCDNVPFNSSAFIEYANRTNVAFVFSSPRFPQSNGLAEKGVAIAKNILKRCIEMREPESFQYRLLEYNTTPVALMGLTPAELFFGRQLKTRLPIARELLMRSSLSNTDIVNKMNRKYSNQKRYYDRSTRQLPTLNVGEKIIFKKNAKEEWGNIPASEQPFIYY